MPAKSETNAVPVPQGASLDAFLGGRVRLLQPKTGHRAGTDAVFLAAAVAARQDEKVEILDAGAGVGVAGFCLLARLPAAHVTAVEREAQSCRLAAMNAELNGFEERFRIIETDLTASAKQLADKGLARESYPQLIANPPFYAPGRVRPAPGKARADAHVMPDGELEAWVKFLATFAAAKATLTLIHRPEALPELLRALEPRFGDLVLFPLFPREGAPASRIILQGRKGARGPLRIRQGLVLHRPDGTYTDTAEAVLRHAAPLAVSG
jgi:tRNA1(Val) A37 N6-methylase TrmN6